MTTVAAIQQRLDGFAPPVLPVRRELLRPHPERLDDEREQVLGLGQHRRVSWRDGDGDRIDAPALAGSGDLVVVAGYVGWPFLHRPRAGAQRPEECGRVACQVAGVEQLWLFAANLKRTLLVGRGRCCFGGWNGFRVIAMVSGTCCVAIMLPPASASVPYARPRIRRQPSGRAAPHP